MSESGEEPTESLGDELVEALSRLASGDFSVRVERTYDRDTRDILANFINVIAEENGRIVQDSRRATTRLNDGVDEINRVFLAMAQGDFSARVRRDDSGDPLDTLGFFTNSMVEELEANFAAQAHQRAVLRSVIDAIADGVILMGPQGEVAEANPAAASLLDRELTASTSFFDLVREEQDRALLAKVVAGEAPPFSNRDVGFLLPDGRPLSLVVSARTVESKSDVGGGIVFTMRDERELRQTRAQLQATDRLATMGTLAASVAHEINNPMSFLISNVEFAVEELEMMGTDAVLAAELHAELLAALKAAKEGGDRVARIVRDLKAISRIDQESMNAVRVQDVLDKALSMLRRTIRPRARVVRAYEDLPPIQINEARVVQVCVNLLQNAAQAIPRGDPAGNVIRVEATMPTSHEVVIAVTDSGVGIPPDKLETIFQPFETSKSNSGGTGLGLAISKRLVEGMRGRIDVESKVGRTTFRVVLPARRSTAP